MGGNKAALNGDPLYVTLFCPLCSQKTQHKIKLLRTMIPIAQCKICGNPRPWNHVEHQPLSSFYEETPRSAVFPADRSSKLEEAHSLMLEAEASLLRAINYKLDIEEASKKFNQAKEKLASLKEKTNDRYDDLNECLQLFKEVLNIVEKNFIIYSIGYIVALTGGLTPIEIEKGLVECTTEKLLPLSDSLIDFKTFGPVIMTSSKLMAHRLLDEVKNDFISKPKKIKKIRVTLWELKGHAKSKYLCWGEMIGLDSKKIRDIVEGVKHRYRVGSFEKAEEYYHDLLSKKAITETDDFEVLEELWKGEYREVCEALCLMRLRRFEWITHKTLMEEIGRSVYDEKHRPGRVLNELINNSIVETKNDGNRQLLRLRDEYFQPIARLLLKTQKIVKVKVVLDKDRSHEFIFLRRYTIERVKKEIAKIFGLKEDFELLFGWCKIQDLQRTLEDYKIENGDRLEIK
jgi:hypothetical protein